MVKLYTIRLSEKQINWMSKIFNVIRYSKQVINKRYNADYYYIMTIQEKLRLAKIRGDK